MSEQIASHSDESQQDSFQEAVADARAAFGLDTPASKQDTPEVHEDVDTDDQNDGNTDAPAIEQPEPRMIKVKHNKEEIDVDVSDDKLPEYVQKALALDKERERKTALERDLERLAKLQGYQSHSDMLANIDRMEQEAKQRENDQFLALKKQLREEFEDNGLDPDKAEQYLDNHPLIRQANQAIIDRQKAELEQKVQQSEQVQRQKWDALYAAFPDLVETSRAFDDGGAPDWFTPEMQTRIERGYDPLDAYQLAHSRTIAERNKKAAEQKAIKDQRLGLRAQVETNGRSEIEPEVPAELESAFSLFGLDKKSAKKYVKK